MMVIVLQSTNDPNLSPVAPYAVNPLRHERGHPTPLASRVIDGHRRLANRFRPRSSVEIAEL